MRFQDFRCGISDVTSSGRHAPKRREPAPLVNSRMTLQGRAVREDSSMSALHLKADIQTT